MKRISIILFLLATTIACKKDQEESLVDIYVPNAFSPSSYVDCPDGDPTCNRGFKATIKASTLIYLKSFDLRIYAADQTVVFRTVDPNQSWDGYYRGQPVEGSNSFRYLIKYTDTNDHTAYREGTVLLLR